MNDYILIRYGELALKGGNRSFFEKQLGKNLKRARHDLDDCPIHRLQGRFLAGPITGDGTALAKAFAKVFGVSSLSLVHRTNQDLDNIKEKAKAVTEAWLNDHSAPEQIPFKVAARRADKSFPLTSMAAAMEIGGHLNSTFNRLKPKMVNPDLLVEIDIRNEGVFISAGRIKGPGGLPVGTQGQALLLLSGGIDSPVAGWLAMKRGVRLQAVHFESRPYTSLQARQKVEDLTAVLSRQGYGIKLHIIPFTAIQEAIHENSPSRYHTVLHRRAMHRLAQALARRERIRALVTGEALGQVASQTLENLALSAEVVDMPILRPLITFDKEETITLAEKIGTYEISVRPFEDCCTIFTPKRPIIKGKGEDARQAEECLPLTELLAAALAQTETITL